MRMSEYFKADREKRLNAPGAQIEKFERLTIIREELAGRLYSRIWIGNQGKHTYTIYKDAAQREAHIERLKANELARNENVNKRRANDRASQMIALAQRKVGDILYRTWGYDQTNADFYQVVRKTESRIVVREIKHTEREDGFMCGDAMPLRDQFSSAEMMIHPDKYSAWNGAPVRVSWYA